MRSARTRATSSGISNLTAARPIEAALSSALAFAIGAALPLVIAALLPVKDAAIGVGVGSLAILAALGAASARIGHARLGIAAWRVTLWGALAMAVSGLIGAAVGTGLG